MGSCFGRLQGDSDLSPPLAVYAVWIAFLAALTLILGAAYTLWLVKRVIFGKVANENVAALKDINRREFIMLSLVAVLVLLVGIWPNPLVTVMHASVDNLIQHVIQSKLPL